MQLISSSIYIDESKGDLETVHRFLEQWDQNFVRPLFSEFVGSFAESLKNVLTVPGFNDLLKLQLQRNSAAGSAQQQASAMSGEGQMSDEEMDTEIEQLIGDIAVLEFKRATAQSLRSVSKNFEKDYISKAILEGTDLESIEQFLNESFQKQTALRPERTHAKKIVNKDKKDPKALISGVLKNSSHLQFD